MTLKYNEQGHPYEDPTEENKKLKNRVKELDNSLSIALDINDKFQRENVNLEKQKEILKAACKKAGSRIKELEDDRKILLKDIDRLSEYNQNLEMMKNDRR